MMRIYISEDRSWQENRRPEVNFTIGTCDEETISIKFSSRELWDIAVTVLLHINSWIQSNNVEGSSKQLLGSRSIDNVADFRGYSQVSLIVYHMHHTICGSNIWRTDEWKYYTCVDRFCEKHCLARYSDATDLIRNLSIDSI